MDLISQISKVGKSEYAIGALYAGVIGMIASDIIPTPADALYFYKQRKWRVQLENGEISSRMYWTKDALGYYGFNFMWWLGVLGITVSIEGSAHKKLGVLGALIGTGAVVAILAKNVKDDNKSLNK